MRLFEVKDKTGRIIYLTDERWQHIVDEHPNLVYELETLKRAILQPSCIIQSPKNPAVHSYLGRCKNKPEAFLLAVVKYLNGEGFILTGYFIGRIK